MEEEIMTKGISNRNREVDSDTESKIQNLGNGQPLKSSEKEFFETRFD